MVRWSSGPWHLTHFDLTKSQAKHEHIGPGVQNIQPNLEKKNNIWKFSRNQYHQKSLGKTAKRLNVFWMPLLSLLLPSQWLTFNSPPFPWGSHPSCSTFYGLEIKPVVLRHHNDFLNLTWENIDCINIAKTKQERSKMYKKSFHISPLPPIPHLPMRTFHFTDLADLGEDSTPLGSKSCM